MKKELIPATSKTYRTSSLISVCTFTLLLALFNTTSAFAENTIVFYEVETPYLDSDTLGAYGDENDEEVIEDHEQISEQTAQVESVHHLMISIADEAQF